MLKVEYGFVVSFVIIFLVSCSTLEKREPAALPTVSDIELKVQSYKELVGSPSFNNGSCQKSLSEIRERMETLDWNAYTNDELKGKSKQLIDLFWKFRLQLHGRLSDIGMNCNLEVREIFHRLHDHEDYLAEFAYEVPALDPSKVKFQNQPVPIYDRQFYPPYLVRSDVDDSKFKFSSGDLMLARGVSFFSAIISQISDNRSQFSHVVFVNEDAQTKKLNTIESYVNVGVSNYDMDFALKNENARLLILRPKDRQLGERAADLAMQAGKKRVPYDYNMNFKDYSKMSCVEVARYAYDVASQGSVMTPQYPAKLQLNNSDFLNKLNLNNGDLITPDDLETDPRFELVLDWRDYRLVRDSRHKDAILSEMVRWLNDLGYKFHETPKSLVAKNILHPARKTRLWPLLRKITGSPDIDPALPKKTLGVMTVLNEIGLAVLEKLQLEEQSYIEKYKRPMTNSQLREAVNRIRQEDLASFQDSGYSILHGALRPDGVYRGHIREGG